MEDEDPSWLDYLSEYLDPDTPVATMFDDYEIPPIDTPLDIQTNCMKRNTDQTPPQPECALNDPPQQNVTGSSNSHQQNVTGSSNSHQQNVAGSSNSHQQNVAGSSNSHQQNVAGSSNSPQQNIAGSSSSNSHQYQLSRDDRNSIQNRAPGRNSFQPNPVQPRRENQRMSQSWPANNYNNTNKNPWESDWGGNPSAKNDSWSGNSSAKNDSWSGNSSAKNDSWSGNSFAKNDSWSSNPSAKNDSWSGNPPVKNEHWAGNSSDKNDSWSGNPPAKNEPWAGSVPVKSDPWGSNTPAKSEPWAGNPPVKNEPWGSNHPAKNEPWAVNAPVKTEPWSGNPPVKSEPEQNDYYKQQQQNPSRVHPPPSYPSSGGEWPPGPSTSSGASGYGMMPHGPRNSAAGSSYSENNGYGNYNSSYNNYGQLPYTQSNNYNPQSSYHQPTRMSDSYQQHQQPKQQYQHHHNQQPSYHHQQPKQHYPPPQYPPHHQSQYPPHPRSQPPQSGNNISRMPSVCPPKQDADRCGQVPDFHHTQRQYGMGMVPRVEIKQEPPDDYPTAENENFSSIFSHSLSSLYNDLENGEDPDIMLLDSQPRLDQPTTPVLPPQEMNPLPVENHVTYQRLHSSGGHFVLNPSIDLRDAPSTSYGNYGNGVIADSQGNVMQEIGAPSASNSFRYDRPSFDDMHLYGPSTSSDTRTPAKKRKSNGPPAPTESSSERSKKGPRMMHLNSESQWTPNSFGFDGNGVKQEPMDDYGPSEVETPGGPPHDTSSPGSSGTGSNSRPSDQSHDYKQPQKKRSPTTCFERFEKKSVDAKKKVSPISVYSKTHDNFVIGVKCRRYKKRTKPAKAEECSSPCRMEVETYKQYSLTPEQAAFSVMRDILGRVTLIQERFELGATDLSEMDPYRIQQLFIQFCHRYNLDYRDFENTELILIPRIIADTMAKNSERASAIRRRINSPSTVEPQPSTSGTQQQQREVKTKRRRTRAEEPENSTGEPVEPRVLRQLPWRQARTNVSGYSPFALSARNGSGENVDVIDLSSEEEQAGREAEVRKKSQPSKGKRPSRKTQVKGDRSFKEGESKESPSEKSRSNTKGKQPARRKSLVEICLDDSEGPPAARSRSRDKSKKPARESSVDECSNGGLAVIQIKQEPIDDYPSTELEASTWHFETSQGCRMENCKPTEMQNDDVESQKKCENESNSMEQSVEEFNIVPVPSSVEDNIACNVRLSTIQINQEPIINDSPTIELSHQETFSLNSGIKTSHPMDPQDKQESTKNAKDQSLETTRNNKTEEFRKKSQSSKGKRPSRKTQARSDRSSKDGESKESPTDKSRSNTKGKQPARKKSLVEICLDNTGEPPAARSRFRDKSKMPTGENSVDDCTNGRLAVIQIKQEPMDDYPSNELKASTSHFETLQESRIENCNPTERKNYDFESQKECEIESNAMGKSVEEFNIVPVAGSVEDDIACNVRLSNIQIKQEPIDGYPLIESSHQETFSLNSGIKSSQPLYQPMKPQDKQESTKSAKEKSLEETRNRDLEKDSGPPAARSRSRSKGKQSARKNQVTHKKSLDKNICYGGLEEICIKQEPIDNCESNEFVTTVSLHPNGYLESSEIGNTKLPEQLKKAKQQQRNKENVSDQSLEQVTDCNLEVRKEPVARSRSKNKGGRTVGKKQLASKKSLDKLNFAGLEGLKIKQELMDDYEAALNQVPTQGISSENRGTRSRSSEQPKNVPKEPPKKRGRSIASTRGQSLETVGTYESFRRCTRSSSRKSEVLDVDYIVDKPLTRKRLRSMYSSDSTQTQEIVDITRSSSSDSPPLLVPVNMEGSTSALLQTKSKISQTKGKNTARGRKAKNKNISEKDSPSVSKKQAKVKTEDAYEDEPPVLRKVSRKRTVNSRYIDDDIYVVPSGSRSRSRSNSSRTEPPTLPVIDIKIKQEPVSPPKKCQNNNFEQLNCASAKKAHDYDSSLPDSIKELKNKGPETPKNTVVKSGSSKRKQGDPTKFQKDKFKNIRFPKFLQPSSIPMTVASSIEPSTKEKNSKPNSNVNFSSPKISTTSSAMPGTANSSETLKERYRKSFCSQPLPSTNSGHPKELEETRQKFASFLKSRKPMKKSKESLAQTLVPKPEHSSSAQNFKPNFSNNILNQTSKLSIHDVKIKEEPISDEDIPLSQLADAAYASDLKMKSKKKPVRCTPTKKIELRRSSKCSIPEPQVAEPERMNVEVKNREQSETDSDDDKPLYLLKKVIKEQERQEISSTKSRTSKQSKAGKPTASPNHSKRYSTEEILPEIGKNKRAVRRRVSESEDSECELVIDLDRRPSVEDRVPSYKLQRLNTIEDFTETENRNAITPQESKITSLKIPPVLPNTPTINFSSLTASPPTSKAETLDNSPSLPSETPKPDNSSLFRDATEEAHILLELSRSGPPPLDISEPTLNLSRPPLDISGPPLDISGPPLTSRNPKVDTPTGNQEEATVKEQDESILRTLLLENGETLQEATPIPFDTKLDCAKQYTTNLPPQEIHNHSPLSELDKKQILEEIHMTPDQLWVELDTNPSFIPANYECCLNNPKSTLEVVQKLRDQIRYLQRKSERKNTSVLNLKRISKLCKYKEEVLKRLTRRANMKEHIEWSQPNTQAAKLLSSHQPTPMATSSYAATSRLSSALLGNSLLKSKTPSATVTSNDCYPGENLPTVATMVANATENYGVDLRTVTNREPSSRTILKEVLSSKDPIYRPVAIRSPLPQLERSSESFLPFPISPLVSMESTIPPHRTSSPMLPELSRTSQLSRRILTPPGSSSQFPPILQPEPRSSSFIPVVQGSFRTMYATEAAKTIKGAPKLSRKRSTSRTNPLSFGFQPNSFDSRAAQSSTVGANPIPSSQSDSQGYHVSSGRYMPYDNRTYPVASNQESSIDLRTNPMSYTSLDPGRIANTSSPFMIVPPPTTLQSAFSERIRRSMLDGEMPADRQMERISERRNEGPIPLFVPQAGPLKPASSKRPKCAGCGRSKGCFICSLCKSTYYCSTKCQNMHWDEHSKTCSSEKN
ncbi:hypothetical protein JTE90_013084 [Oedothorax gibbosus]|uniref:MYND-type domain-containing protein n=1 Tax=Oedothorax gibbosus TaxID=931172 RepID=A0AAV6UM29_9ARAC|nr:hypothetical protein JTE90_013084 [Oedothorax gibbosus]